MTKKEQKVIINHIESIAKRSKYININNINTYFSRCRIDIKMPRQNLKIAKELMAYLYSVCPYYDDDRDSKWGAQWFHSYDDSRWDLPDEDEYEFEICVTDW